MAGSKKERKSKGSIQREGSKDPSIPLREHATPKTEGLERFQSIMNQEDLSLVRLVYCIPRDFELEFSGANSQIDNPPLGRLGVYKKALESGLRFPISSIILEFLRTYGVLLCVQTLNFIRLLIGFFVICFLVEIQPSLSLFCSFYTTQKYPYTKVWWYLTL